MKYLLSDSERLITELLQQVDCHSISVVWVEHSAKIKYQIKSNKQCKWQKKLNNHQFKPFLRYKI
jgi:hypothetical protein